MPFIYYTTSYTNNNNTWYKLYIYEILYQWFIPHLAFYTSHVCIYILSIVNVKVGKRGIEFKDKVEKQKFITKKIYPKHFFMYFSIHYIFVFTLIRLRSSTHIWNKIPYMQTFVSTLVCGQTLVYEFKSLSFSKYEPDKRHRKNHFFA